MFQNSQTFYPRWFVEGFAEYYGTTKILDDQAVVGMALSWRIRQLSSSGTLTYEDILRDAPSTRRSGSNFYPQSWLLTHWILSDPARREAFRQYLQRRSKGEEAVAAFEAAFGVPVKSLSSVLWSYMNSLKATVYRIRDMPDPKITLSPMPVSVIIHKLHQLRQLHHLFLHLHILVLQQKEVFYQQHVQELQLHLLRLVHRR